MPVRTGGRYLADKNGKVARDPKDEATKPAPGPGEKSKSAATYSPPDKLEQPPAEEPAAKGKGT
ncbi:hypothetical protein [Hansschlegelia zhihuaiae]|uniref:Uncharacterized protein n=1 Tax=Hansschlegelia zhihuaiae TaxID=405005 RepID=A0A4Q0MMS9_9HYPH|nr:hypothetical protein [Hansschlegelia zhihuaiae]RXF75080.1 hypothetical protein EK403_03255 [Hansschlegelia zhihuaiae]